ncbi:MAG: hypothetical protein M1313_09370 [Nitrospirae bacterium]|nr:hypothetical protein [Nitrospirota bacterium]
MPLRLWTPAGFPFLFFVILIVLGGCGGATPGVYGPAYVPECTCCCGGGFTPYAYKQSNHSSIAGPPVATTMLHDTKGPMTDISANGKTQRRQGKSPRH